MRTTCIDPDFRRDPKSDFFCYRCQKSLNGKKHRWIYVDPECNLTAIHPEDAEGIEPVPVGLDCAKRIGLEFSFIINSTQGR
ncbi:MAG TPA: hypothetical protein ENH65_11050 [Candidatus Aminicenantes bacterium]|nr:hypothetical protein [Candidatus Aminicenantes bacterium]